MSIRLSLCVAIVALAFSTFPVWAHHGWGGNLDEEFELSGVVNTGVSLAGPHATMKIRAADGQRNHRQADIDAEEKRRSHPGVQPPRPVPHHAIDGEMAEDVGEDQLAVLRPRHAPGADQVEIKRPGTGRVVNVIDGGEDLRRADQQRRPGEERDPQHARDRLRRAWRGVPAAIERVQAEEQSGLHDGGRLRDEELHAVTITHRAVFVRTGTLTRQAS